MGHERADLVEVLGLKDIPEPLYLLVKGEENEQVMTRRIFDLCWVPLKSLSVLLGSVLCLTEKTSTRELINPGVPVIIIVMEEQLESAQVVKGCNRPLSNDEMRMEEDACTTSAELVYMLTKRLLESQSETRSKKSDYDLPSETIWNVRVLPHCRIYDERKVVLN